MLNKTKMEIKIECQFIGGKVIYRAEALEGSHIIKRVIDVCEGENLSKVLNELHKKLEITASKYYQDAARRAWDNG